MNTIKSILLTAGIIATTAFSAQLKTPQPSPTATIKQTIGLSEVTVVYSRPGMKERKIFGELVALGEIWRTGANGSTTIEISNDVKIGGKDVPAGKYAFYTIPGETEWTIIIHKNTTNWGSGNYKEEEDLVRFTAKPTKLDNAVESFTIDFGSFKSGNAIMMLSWENTRVSFPIESNADEAVEKQIKELLIDGPSAGTYYSAARHYLDNDKDMTQALTWVNTAIEKRPEAFWYIHQKAKIQGKLGKTKEAIATAEKSMQLAKESKDGDYGYIANNEKLIKQLKEKK
jgi:hypothetical protein